MGEDNLLVTELLERIKWYKRNLDDMVERASAWEDAYCDLKIEERGWYNAYHNLVKEYDDFRREMFSEDIIKEPPYYETQDIVRKIKTTGVGEQVYKFDACPTLDNLVDLEKKLKQADTIGC